MADTPEDRIAALEQKVEQMEAAHAADKRVLDELQRQIQRLQQLTRVIDPRRN